MLHNLTTVVGLVAVQYRILDQMEMMKTAIDEEGNDEYDEDVDDECNGDADVEADGHASSFRTLNQVLENEQGIYVLAQAPSCDVSNHLDDERLDESSLVHYHLPPTP